MKKNISQIKNSSFISLLFILIMAMSLSLIACKQKPDKKNIPEITIPEITVPEDRTYSVDGVSFVMKGIAGIKKGLLGNDEMCNNKAHTVNLSSYLMAETEVTQELWEKIMLNNPSFFHGGEGREIEAGENQKNRPVETVSWYHAVAFCNKLSIKLNLEPCYKLTISGEPVNFANIEFNDIPNKHSYDWDKVEVDMNKKGFRLPTEAEWEWAAKGGGENRWAGTNDETLLNKYAWSLSNSGKTTTGYAKTHEVKKKLPNNYGLYDMTGNVWEWCWNWYDDNETPPDGEDDPVGISEGDIKLGRSRRGGSCGYGSNVCRVFLRDKLTSGGWSNSLGIRLVMRP